MDRRSQGYGYLAAAIVAFLAILATAGCKILPAVAYIIKGTEVEPEFPGLKEKKVAVVCRPLVALQYRNAGVTRELAQRLSVFLQDKVAKITVIDQQKVAAWTDEHTWDEYSEVAKALKADMVVGVDLNSFSIFEGQTLYQGKASIVVKVYDTAKKKVVYEKTMPQQVYPPSYGVPVSEKPEPEFRRKFVEVLAGQIGQLFYPHEPYSEVGQDVRAGMD